MVISSLSNPELKMGHGIIPRIVERTSRGEEVWDVFSRLVKDHIIFIGGEINDFEADVVMATLLFMESQDPEKTYISTSILQAALSQPVSLFMIPCSIYDRMYRPSVLGRQPVRQH
jgi:ATP-dependent Clp endopeptidase proteolytic subunit ClpP